MAAYIFLKLSGHYTITYYNNGGPWVQEFDLH